MPSRFGRFRRAAEGTAGRLRVQRAQPVGKLLPQLIAGLNKRSHAAARIGCGRIFFGDKPALSNNAPRRVGQYRGSLQQRPAVLRRIEDLRKLL